MNQPDATRRGFLKELAYVPPAILTLRAIPAFAKVGSNDAHGNDGVNDGVGTYRRTEDDWDSGRPTPPYWPTFLERFFRWIIGFLGG